MPRPGDCKLAGCGSVVLLYSRGVYASICIMGESISRCGTRAPSVGWAPTGDAEVWGTLGQVQRGMRDARAFQHRGRGLS